MRFLLLSLAEEWEQSGILGHKPNKTSVFPPLGLLYIGSILEANGHEVDIIDVGLELNPRPLLEQKLKHADVVGMSVYTNTYIESAGYAHLIKQINPTMPILIGGPHCTFMKSRALKDIPYADIAVELEGENVILEIIKYLEGKKALRDIPGIFYRDRDAVRTGAPLTIVDDLDSLPFPARHLVKHYEYGHYPFGYIVKQKFTSMITSRGCAFHCKFCSRYSNVIQGYGFRQRSAENIVRELREIAEEYRSVSIVDDNFMANPRLSEKVYDSLIAEKINLDIMIVGARADTASSSLYTKAKKAGVRFIHYGIESGNQDVLDFYRKQLTLQQIRDAVTLAREAGFFVSASFIYGGPTETKRHLAHTTDFLCSLPLDTAVIRPFYYDMGAELWTLERNNGRLRDDEYVVRGDVARGLGLLTPTEIDQAIQHAYKRFYFNPSYEIRQMWRALKEKDFSRFKYNLKIVFSNQPRYILR
jgi:anaerobic magnesium-protoporphyrin IX monomethyl ester cyclase